MCGLCWKDPVRYSAANDMDPGPQDLIFRDATKTELSLIALAHPVLKISRAPGGQYKSKGHVINFFQNVSSVATSLPLHPRNLPHVVVRRTSEDGSHFDFKVRPEMITRLLAYLKEHHPSYADIPLNDAAMARIDELFELDGGIQQDIAQIVLPERDRKTSTTLTRMPRQQLGIDKEGWGRE